MPWAAHAIRPSLPLKTATQAPRESWWLCQDAEFSTRASEEFPRMRGSKFGSIQLGTSEADAKIARRRLLPT